MLLDGKVCLITGSGGGLGRAASILFAREGGKILVTDMDEEGGRETIRLVEEVGGEAAFLPGDVSDDEQVRALFDQVLTRDEDILRVSTIDSGLPAESPSRKTEADVLEVFPTYANSATPNPGFVSSFLASRFPSGSHAITIRVTRGASRASPAASVRIAASSSAADASLSRKPLAPARNAS